ncbi:hyoscyamine 6-dioxygenase-like [Coffea eugenioides]|uniref:hyoscyamine 6-dioxygenase-like n=1 Tax=Coffea eugenioides TaxID=49369 RepID=UPI000F60FB4C|nr:hyoscyamine 6-dioxygenase-like [Coffea eugenioides]
MELLLMSNWTDVQSTPETYVFPPDKRPGKLIFPECKDIPTIDLEKSEGLERAEVIEKIMKASQEFGFFQVINHGVSQGLMEDTMSVFQEFFGMPAEYKASFYSSGTNQSCRIYSSTLNYHKEDFHYWRDNFTQSCHPLEDHVQSWPEKPTRYREVTSTYCVEVRKFLLRILDLICEGLGLKLGYFEDELTKIQLLSVNHHIPCPDPSLTLGMPEHCDPNLISMLHQCAVPGLQLFKDGQWLGVEPVPDAFIVIAGLQLKVISNDLFTSPIHRVVTHTKDKRTTIGTFLIPSGDFQIEPAMALVDTGNPPVYGAFTYKEFFSTFTGKDCDAQSALGCFKKKLE